MARGGAVTHATILDRKTNEKETVKEGDELGELKIVRIDLAKRIVQMRGEHLDTITLKYSRK